jgi:hypothetical protein
MRRLYNTKLQLAATLAATLFMHGCDVWLQRLAASDVIIIKRWLRMHNMRRSMAATLALHMAACACEAASGCDVQLQLQAL